MESKITINELRIGNYIADVWSPNSMFPVLELWKNCAKYGDKRPQFRLSAKYENLRGIPLTPEILLKAGLSNEIEEDLPEDADFLVFFKDNYSLELMPDLIGFKYFFTLYKDVIDEEGQLAQEAAYEIEYYELHLHTFQNLIFALTSHELTINI